MPEPSRNLSVSKALLHGKYTAVICRAVIKQRHGEQQQPCPDVHGAVKDPSAAAYNQWSMWDEGFLTFL